MKIIFKNSKSISKNGSSIGYESMSVNEYNGRVLIPFSLSFSTAIGHSCSLPFVFDSVGILLRHSLHDENYYLPRASRIQ